MTVFPLVISWFLTFGYVPANGRILLEVKQQNRQQSPWQPVAQIGLSASTDDELFTIYTDMKNFQYAPGALGQGFRPFPY